MRFRFSLIFLIGLLISCGDSDSPQEKSTTAKQAQEPVESSAVAEEAVHLPVDIPDQTPTDLPSAKPAVATSPVYIPNQVVYQEEIYKNWPYTEAVADVSEPVKESVEANIAVVGDKPYQVVDGKISENALNGWRTYNGGGCGTCHGKGGIGAVGPNLAISVKNVLTKEQFMDVVINGRSGTMMRPHKTNKRVMDNLEDLYVYLLARADDVLGPGNLIKQPLGK